MRFSTLSLLALPLIAAAQETPLEQAKAQAQYWFDKISSYIPNPNKQAPQEAFTATVGEPEINILTLDDWEQTIRGSVKAESTQPEQWWILATGGNKTCYGLCAGVEAAFNESAALFAVDPTAPHLALLDCDNQPVLCNSWGAGPPHLWILEVSTPPAPVDIRLVSLNTTTTTVRTFTDLHTTQSWKEKPLYEGYFHPFDGPIAQFGLAVPIGYVLWALAVVPSWMFMIGISFLSRTFMSRKMPAQRPTAPGAPAPAAN